MVTRFLQKGSLVPCLWGRGGAGGPQSEVQCIMGNGHMGTPPPYGQTDTTETLPSCNFENKLNAKEGGRLKSTYEEF